MLEKILASLEGLPIEDLKKVKEHLARLIHRENQKTFGKREGKRARTKLSGSLEIEREKEFFDQTHKIQILEMSTNGLLFRGPAIVIQDDILEISFRHPSSGKKKVIDCQAVRVQEIRQDSRYIYEVAAKAVTKDEVRAFRDMMRKRGR